MNQQSEADKTTRDTSGLPPSFSDALGMIMANPEIISGVMSALGNLQGKEAPASEKEDTVKARDTTPEEKETGGVPDVSALMGNLTPLISGLGKAPHHKSEGGTHQREALLCALKPYVSQGRRDAIDYIIRISQISDLLKNIKS